MPSPYYGSETREGRHLVDLLRLAVACYSFYAPWLAQVTRPVSLSRLWRTLIGWV